MDSWDGMFAQGLHNFSYWSILLVLSLTQLETPIGLQGRIWSPKQLTDAEGYRNTENCCDWCLGSHSQGLQPGDRWFWFSTFSLMSLLTDDGKLAPLSLLCLNLLDLQVFGFIPLMENDTNGLSRLIQCRRISFIIENQNIRELTL